jgi:NodT family efflux transporter outer membrane factor (OMF) lipoprotein
VQAGCIKVGPDFTRPDAPVSARWLESGDSRISNAPVDYREWWRVFNDPALNRVIDLAYRQNLTLKVAALRVVEARAQLGISIGMLFPQDQRLIGSYQFNRVSERAFQAGALLNQRYDQAEVGGTASWEIDFWGKYRRNIESAKDLWKASLADYDNALVSLTADAATFYIAVRTLEKRVDVALQSLETQREGLAIAEARYDAGTTSFRDVEQARSLLMDTQAAVPVLMTQLRQAKNALSVLLGSPPGDLTDLLSGGSGIPAPPAEVPLGIPADLLRRRPDIRSAEYQAASQCARIGIAKADLFPAFSLTGIFEFIATDVGNSSTRDVFRWGSRQYTWGPAGDWKVLNYGRLLNAVRVEDARFEQAIAAYGNTVLKAQQEVEDAVSGFLRSQERAELLAGSVASAKNSLIIAHAQYRGGVADYTTVLSAQQALLNGQDNLASTLGDISRYLTAVYRALGGGWQIRENMSLLPGETKDSMAKRTHWGNLLEPAVYVPRDGP